MFRSVLGRPSPRPVLPSVSLPGSKPLVENVERADFGTLQAPQTKVRIPAARANDTPAIANGMPLT